MFPPPHLRHSPSALADSYYAIQGREIVIRRLKTKEPRSEMQQQVESFVKSVLGQKPPSIEEMVMAVLKQGPALNAFLSHLRGSKEIEDDLSSLFCSKLVAAVYKHVGLIGPDRTLGDFLPKHFSAQYDGYVDLQGGAKLGPEITISFDAVQAEVDEVRPVVSTPPLPPPPAPRPAPAPPRPAPPRPPRPPGPPPQPCALGAGQNARCRARAHPARGCAFARELDIPHRAGVLLRPGQLDEDPVHQAPLIDRQGIDAEAIEPQGGQAQLPARQPLRHRSSASRQVLPAPHPRTLLRAEGRRVAPLTRNQPPTRPLPPTHLRSLICVRSPGGKGTGDDDDDRVSTASPVSTATDLTPSNTEPPTAASSPSKSKVRPSPSGDTPQPPGPLHP